MNIEKINFHDAIIENIILSSDNDFIDKIEIIVKTSNERISLLFSDCFSVKCDFNLWISGMDSIRECYYELSDEYINTLAELRKKGFMPFENQFKFFKIVTNTSNSIIEIVYKDVDISL